MHERVKYGSTSGCWGAAHGRLVKTHCTLRRRRRHLLLLLLCGSSSLRFDGRKNGLSTITTTTATTIRFLKLFRSWRWRYHVWVLWWRGG